MVIWSPGSESSSVGTKPLDSAAHAQSSSNSNTKENALRSSWIQRLRPISGTNVASFREKKSASTSSGVPSLLKAGEQQPRQWLDENAWSNIKSGVDSGKKKMVEQEADDDSAIRHGYGSVEVGETSSCSASKALCMQNYARSQQDECMKESLQHPENVESSYSRPEYLQQRLYAGTASPLVRCPSQSDCNSAEQSGLRWAGYSAQFGAYNQGSAKPALCSPKYDHLPPETRISVGPSGNLKKISCVHGKPGIGSNIVQFPQLGSNSFSKFPSGLEGTPCPSHELNEAAKDSRRFGQNCSSSSQLLMQGKAHMTKHQPLLNDGRPSQSDPFFKKVLNSKNVLSSGVGGNLFGNCTTKPPEHGSKIGRAGYHSNEDEHRRISPDPFNLEGYVMNGLSMSMKEKKAGFAKPRTFVEQLLGADRLIVEQGSDQAYVLTPIFAETDPFFQSEKKKSITTMLHKERPESVSVSIPTTDTFFASGAKGNIKKLGQHSASAVPNHKSKEQQGLDFHLTSLTHSQRPLTQVTTDSVTASLPKEFVGDLYRGTCSLDPEQHFEGSFPYKDVLRAQSSSSPTRGQVVVESKLSKLYAEPPY